MVRKATKAAKPRKPQRKAKPAGRARAASAPRRVKGGRPHFFNDPAIDKLLFMVMNLAAEMSVMRDRLDTHERLAAKGAFSAADVEGFVPDDAVLTAREAWRKRFLDKLLKAIDE